MVKTTYNKNAIHMDTKDSSRMAQFWRSYTSYESSPTRVNTGGEEVPKPIRCTFQKRIKKYASTTPTTCVECRIQKAKIT